jgi:hypothetical protein
VSAQMLGAKALRRIERAVGEPVLRGWSHGGYVMGFVTPDHRHGWWDKKTGKWGMIPDAEVTHYTSCREFEGPRVGLIGEVREGASE